MPKTRGTGLLMLWTDVDPEHEAEFLDAGSPAVFKRIYPDPVA